jgi:tetratricopeptide (TPR) repeat protein
MRFEAAAAQQPAAEGRALTPPWGTAPPAGLAGATPFGTPPPGPPPAGVALHHPSPFDAAPAGDSPFAEEPAHPSPFGTPPPQPSPFAAEPAHPSPFGTPPPFAPPPGARSTPPPFAPVGAGGLEGPPPEEPLPAAPLGFGEVDLGGPAPAAAPAHADAVPQDDPFGDVAASPAPPPPSSPGALGQDEARELEALFDERAGAAAPARRPAVAGAEWRIRRRSGKVFGPFPEAEVVEMLGRGELLGNEEVSADNGERWSAIGEVPAFGEAIRRLIERPAPQLSPAPPPRAPKAEPAAPLAEGEKGPSAVSRLLGRLPGWARYAIPAVAAGLLLGGGLALGLTDYGVFLHRLVLGQVGPNRPGAKLCAEARTRFAEDRFSGARAALAAADRAVAQSPVDWEAKGIYAQVAFWMARRTGSEPDVQARATAFLAEIGERAPRAADTAKALVSAGLAPGGTDRAQAALEVEKWLASSPRDEDAAYLLGERALAQGDLGRAEGLFQRVEQLRAGARASHALGLVAAAQANDKVAKARFEEALQRDPTHLASGIELAQLAVRAADVPGARARLDALLAPPAAEALGPRERAAAHQLRGEILARLTGDDAEARLAEAEKELQRAVDADPTAEGPRVAMARFQLRRSAPDKALTALQPVAQSGGAAVANAQVRALAAAGRALDATTALDAAQRRWPGDPRLTYAKGLLLQAAGKRAEAEALFAEAAKDRSAWEPQLALGLIRLQAGDAAGATPSILAAVEKAPGEPDAQSALGELRLAQGDLAGAEEALTRALALDPTHPPSHLARSRVARRRGDEAGAVAALEKAVRFDPRLVEARLELGAIRWRSGDLAGAEVQFAGASAADPTNAKAKTRLGAVRLELGKVEAALADLYAASNTDVALPENRYWLGRALLAKGEAAQAVDELARAVALDGTDARFQLWLGQALERRAKPAEATDAYREALERDPKLGEAAERLGLLQAAVGRPAEAVPWLEKAIALAPRDQRLRMELADVRVKLGQHAEAIKAYRDALKADPKLVELHYRIARAVHESQGAKAATPWYEQAVRLEPKNPMPHYYMGFAYKARGQRGEAVRAFKRYLELKPDAEDRRDIEQEIEDLQAR